MDFLLLLFCHLAYSNDLLAHRFSQNFGQVFYDYSGNQRYSINGLSPSDSTNDVISTDRGVYFPLFNSTVILPPNTLSDFSLATGQFSIVFWSLIEDYSFYFIYFKSPATFLYLRRYSINQNLAYRVNSPSFDTSEVQTSPLTLVYGTWNLVILSIGTSLKLTINQSVLSTTQLSSIINLNVFTYNTLGQIDIQNSIVGYIYNIIITDTESNYATFLSGPSSNCIIQSCQPCSFSVLDSAQPAQSGCLPVISSPFKDSNSNLCYCSESCSGSICLSCSQCLAKSCVIKNSQVVCECPQNSVATTTQCLCSSGYYLSGNLCFKCGTDCATCTGAGSCLTCISSNTQITAPGCSCLSGYYNLTRLTTLTSCIPCNSACNGCDSTGNCLACKDLSANVTSGCSCLTGYYFENTCKPCFSECFDCSSYGKCLICVDLNASPSSFGCKCNKGFGSQSPLTSPNTCQKCDVKCLTCSSASQCLTCSDPKGVAPNCSCSDGYYSENLSCLPCPSNCQRCNGTSCTQCYDSNAIVSGNDCICPNKTYVYQASPLVCKPCLQDCKTCSDGTTCDECLIIGAVKKSIGCGCEAGFYSDSSQCVRCTTWNTELMSCIFCTSNQFFLNGNCSTCPNLCTRCSVSGCQECVKNSHLLDGKCYCNDMYLGVTQCIEANFEVIVSCSNQSLELDFTVQLKNDLTESDFQVVITGQSFSYSVTKVSARSYLISFSGMDMITDPVSGTLTANQNIISIFNQTLGVTQFKFQVDVLQSALDTQKLTQALSATTSSNFYTAFSVTIFLSILNFNFISMWSFLNSVQVLIYIKLIDVGLPIKLNVILSALRECTVLVNFFNWFVNPKDFLKTTGAFFRFGFKTNSILLNDGHLLTVFILLLGTMALAYFLKKLLRFRIFQYQIIKENIEDFWNSFHYSAFLRYLIQTYMDFGVCCALTFSYTEVFTVNELVNYIICIVLSVFLVLIPIQAAVFTKKKQSLLKSGNKELLDKYGTLFYEFSNDQGLMSSYFYFFYFVRRVLYIVIIFGIRSQTNVQLALYSFLSVFFLVYLYTYSPYSEKLVTYSNIMTEFLNSALVVLLQIYINYPKYFSEDVLDTAFATIIYVIFFLQTLVPLIILIRNIKEKIKESCYPKKPENEPAVEIASDSRLQRYSYPSKRVYAWTKELNSSDLSNT